MDPRSAYNDGGGCNCIPEPRHFIVKKITDVTACLHGDSVNRYTEKEARQKAKKLAASNRCRFGVFQLVGAYEPVDNVRLVEPKDL